MQLKVAVLEDDMALREDILVPQLADAGFDVEGFASSAELYRRMVAVPFHLLVLDLRLDGESGLEVARYLGEVSSIGIVMLTGRGSDDEKLRAVADLVDAWLPKPIEIELLVATLRGIARRAQLSARDRAGQPTIECWRLSESGWRLHAPSGRSIAVNLLERRLLTRLLAAGGEPVGHDELIADLSTVAENFDRHRLEIVIHRLRRKADRQLGLSLPLRAVRGVGYMMLVVEERSLKR
ncbi:response regulator [Dokdonella sp.]|uniref:response regulator transcription factor n=1 Tax=Dokdonella sp. TaxID=2291710 RepID=UPI001B1761D4|nr:response regulator [Dokdonella sp.]MBO9664657.1 response regulator transcription factor [Dokdonella sp.]